MKRRSFITALTALLGAGSVSAETRSFRRQTDNQPDIELQRSPIAGFQYHEGEAVWDRLSVNDDLHLIREPENRYDPRAVRVEWRGYKLGYVPRIDNAACCHLLDNGRRLSARIVALNKSHNPWKRIQFAVHLTER
ncbi:HIRAN domain-containing protein [Methylotuvimicrobium sp. KM2]|uniref:HIRAN domain-containing protein n=1 Tax=Methylotuvimicrobium sp. KM2 TaxID=3133976 RepID=UPI0031012CC4